MQEDTYRGTASDPLSLNLYTYCNNEPIMYYDPTGHVVSKTDQNKLTRTQKAAVNRATIAYNTAKKNGDKKGMAAAHATAEKIRNQAGYSGGTDGTGPKPKQTSQTVTKKSTSSISTGATGTNLLQGSSGTGVAALQQQLNTLGGYNLAVDGSFGPATEQAVRDFQRRNGLKIDGKVGPATSAVLSSAPPVVAISVTVAKPVNLYADIKPVNFQGVSGDHKTLAPGPVRDSVDAIKVQYGIHERLEFINYFPGVGDVTSLAESGIYWLEGDKVNAGVAAAMAVPFLSEGKAIVKTVGGAVDVAKDIKKVVNGTEAAVQSAKQVNWKSVKEFGHTFNTHGAGSSNTNALAGRAAGTGQNQGQWLDNQNAANYIKSLGEIKTTTTVNIPAGMGQVITPTGEILPATRAIIVPSDTGIKTAYPLP